MHINPISRSRVSRIAWSLFRHPVKSREFPAKAERLITADELLRLRRLANCSSLSRLRATQVRS